MSTSTLSLTASSGTGRLLGFAGAVARRLVEMGRAWRHRKDIAVLAAFDDRMLADIGLTRGDVRDAAAALPWRDPTTILVSRAGERRRSRLSVISRWTPNETKDLEIIQSPPVALEFDEWSSRLFPARSRYY